MGLGILGPLLLVGKAKGRVWRLLYVCSLVFLLLSSKVSGVVVWCLTRCLVFDVWCFGTLVLDAWYLVFGIWHLVFAIWCLV